MLIILCWKLFTTKTSEIFLLAGELTVTAKRVIHLWFIFFNKTKIECFEIGLSISDWMGKGWTKRHPEIVFFSRASPLILPDLILASLLPQPLLAPLLPFNWQASGDLHSPCGSGFLSVSSDLPQQLWLCLDVQLSLCLQRRFGCCTAHEHCGKFCPSCTATELPAGYVI